LEAGETIIIAPATGSFGGAAVLLAMAMGAKVIAMGRNAEGLGKLKSLSRRVETVQITVNQEEEVAALQKLDPADAFFAISPREAGDSTHIKTAILSLSHAARVSIMSGHWGTSPSRIELSCVKTSNFLENGCTFATTFECL
jgi:NADPH-dependent curcumin reductase CurA